MATEDMDLAPAVLRAAEVRIPKFRPETLKKISEDSLDRQRKVKCDQYLYCLNLNQLGKPYRAEAARRREPLLVVLRRPAGVLHLRAVDVLGRRLAALLGGQELAAVRTRLGPSNAR